MSVKMFCDLCGEPITKNRVRDRLKLHLKTRNKLFDVEIMCAVNGIWNSGELCVGCVRTIIAEGQEYKNQITKIVEQQKARRND